MLQLGRVADEQTPALRTLSAAAPNLTTFFDQLGPFAEVSRPAFKALGQASATGSKAVAAAGSTIAQLKTFAKGTPELANNLDIVLKHLDDRANAAEPDPNSPGGKGYTGLEALLQYVFDQVNSINIYDSSVHILKVSPFASNCENYADTARALSIQEGEKLTDKCGASLGPNSAGLTSPDTTRPDGMAAFGPLTDAQQNPFPTTSARSTKSLLGTLTRPAAGTTPGAAPAAPAAPPAATQAPAPHVPTLSDVIPGAPPVVIPQPPKLLKNLTKAQRAQANQTKLLDYLLGA
jgi:hypothetical protein